MAEQTRTLVVRVVNRPGVLARIASLFQRRAVSIDSLRVDAECGRQYSLMVIRARADERDLRQIARSIENLVDVLSLAEKEG